MKANVGTIDRVVRITAGLALIARAATGPIGLEGDRGVMEYRHIQLKELP